MRESTWSAAERVEPPWTCPTTGERHPNLAAHAQPLCRRMGDAHPFQLDVDATPDSFHLHHSPPPAQPAHVRNRRAHSVPLQLAETSAHSPDHELAIHCTRRQSGPSGCLCSCISTHGRTNDTAADRGRRGSALRWALLLQTLACATGYPWIEDRSKQTAAQVSHTLDFDVFSLELVSPCVPAPPPSSLCGASTAPTCPPRVHTRAASTEDTAEVHARRCWALFRQ
jgi:hypothetical protein